MCFVSAAIGARLSEDASTIRTVIGDALALIVQNVATIVAGLIIAFTSNWILALGMLAVLLLMEIQESLEDRFLKGFGGDAKVSHVPTSGLHTI